jgi:large subunit ribosomal protein L17
MRHNRVVNHLGRTSSHRKAMMANLAASLILHKRISTTVAKAKSLRSFVEPLITKTKEDSTHSRRLVFSYLQNKEAVSELFREVAVKVATRPGGYTRILKTGNRIGDNAEMCIIELVDYNENMLSTAEKAKTKGTRRGRRTSAKKTTEVAPEAQIKETASEKKVAKKEIKSEEEEKNTPEVQAKEITSDKKVSARKEIKSEEEEKSASEVQAKETASEKKATAKKTTKSKDEDKAEPEATEEKK